MSKHYYKATIQYDGTGYSGFQWQEGLRTIQGELTLALQTLDGTASLRAASRTDTGVHALGNVIRIVSQNELDFKTLPGLLNEKLPRQIRCLGASPCEKAFRPAKHCTSKEYRYLFTNTPGESGARRRFIANNPYPINIDLMRACTELLIGEHDFQNFVSLGSKDRPTKRTIFSCELSVIDPRKLFENSGIFAIPEEMTSCYQLRIEGSGFMKHMIRHLMTALWKVGNGRMSVEEFRSLLHGSERVRPTWKLASPKGLFLWKIHY